MGMARALPSPSSLPAGSNKERGGEKTRVLSLSLSWHGESPGKVGILRAEGKRERGTRYGGRGNGGGCIERERDGSRKMRNVKNDGGMIYAYIYTR